MTTHTRPQLPRRTPARRAPANRKYRTTKSLETVQAERIARVGGPRFVEVSLRCPDCGSVVEHVPASEGMVEETYVRGMGMTTYRATRPAAFYACTGCEWCSEAPPAETDQ